MKRLIREYGVGHVISLRAQHRLPRSRWRTSSRELQDVARDAGHGPAAAHRRWTRKAAAWPASARPGRCGRRCARWAASGPRTWRGRWGRRLAAECPSCGINCDFVARPRRGHQPGQPDHRQPLVRRRPRPGGPPGRGHDPRPAGGRGRRLAPSTSPATATPTWTRTSSCPSWTTAGSRLDDVEIRPFRKAIEAGVATMMMAHVLYPRPRRDLPGVALRRAWWTASCAASWSTTAWCSPTTWR